MPNEITAIELARKMFTLLGGNPHMIAWDKLYEYAEFYTLAARAYATLQAQPDPDLVKLLAMEVRELLAEREQDPADKRDRADMLAAEMAEPEKVRCWYSAEDGEVTSDEGLLSDWHELGHTVTHGWFTPDTEGEVK